MATEWTRERSQSRRDPPTDEMESCWASWKKTNQRHQIIYNMLTVYFVQYLGNIKAVPSVHVEYTLSHASEADWPCPYRDGAQCQKRS